MPRGSRPRVEIQFTAGFGQFQDGLRRAASSLRNVGKAAARADRPVRDFVRTMRQAPAYTAAQRTALRRLRGEYRRLGRRVASFQRRVISLRGAITLLAGTSGLGLLVRRSAELGASLVEEARTLRLGVEDYQSIRDALAEEGVQGSTFSRGFTQLQRAIGEAGRGLATYTDAFEALGVSFRRQDGTLRGSAEVFRNLVPALARAGEATAASAGSAIFGARAWREFAPAVLLGANSLAEAERRQRELGVVSDGAARTLKDLNQSFQDTAKALQVLGAELVAAFGPDIERALTRLRDFARRLREDIPGAADRVRQAFGLLREAILFLIALKLAPTITRWVKAMNSLRVATRGAGNAMKLFGQAARTAFRAVWVFLVIEAVIQLGKTIFIVRDEMRQAGLSLGTVFRAIAAQILGAITSALIHAGFAFRGLLFVARDTALAILASFGALDLGSLIFASLTGNTAKVAAELAEAVASGFEGVDLGGSFAAGFEGAKETADAFTTLLRARLGVTEAQIEAVNQVGRNTLARLLGRLREVAEDANDDSESRVTVSIPSLERRGVVGVTEVASLIREAAQPLERLGEAATGVITRLRDELRFVISDLTQGFARVIGDFLVGIKSWQEALRGLVQEIQRAISREITSRLVASITRAIGFGGDLDVPGRQYGGLGRGLTLVGETGPELVDFRLPGRVYSNEALADAIGRRGEVSIVYSPQVVGGTDQIEAALRRDKDELARRLPGLMAQAFRANPSLRRRL